MASLSTISQSARLFERALKVLPGGNSRHTVFYPPHPVYAVSGHGCRIRDVEGVERVDFINNYSALIHGHKHPRIVEALRGQVEKLSAAALPTELEVELAELLCERLPSVEQVRFTNSGTEAVMMALKAARAATGRPKIAKVEGCYHGTYDPAEVSLVPLRSRSGLASEPLPVPLNHGTPEGVLRDVVVLPFNDVSGARRILERQASEIAGVLLDVMPARVQFLRLSSEFLSMVEDFTRRSGSLFILDEVFSFRLGFNGAQGLLGLSPDLTVMGKIIGGGLPVGAVGGRASVMRVFDIRSGEPLVAHGGTGNANPLTMAAGLAAMRELRPEEFERLARLGDRAREGLRGVLSRLGLLSSGGAVLGEGSLLSIWPFERPLENARSLWFSSEEKQRLARFHRGMLERGFLVAPSGIMVLSTPMGEAEIDAMVEAAGDTLRDCLG